ncbi:MAG: hypothetical protein H0T53_01480 [Herpetosiphonaceae bacterium]|nr:hypothetical protein [Herpetosiphonaceae bacterium]
MQYTIDHVANLLDVASEDVALLVRQVVAPLQHVRYYHYLARPRPGGGGGDDESRNQRPRSVLLFTSPDEALAFAHKVRIPETPQVRPIDRSAVVLHMLADERVNRVIFLEEPLEALPPGFTRGQLGSLPGAYALERLDLVERLLI